MKSKYKGVYCTRNPRRSKLATETPLLWGARYTYPDGKMWSRNTKTEREAAIAYDKKMIEIGREPVNILKALQ